jgi:Arc/MetJ-type ribon-helix-helix transcriptional regulator
MAKRRRKMATTTNRHKQPRIAFHLPEALRDRLNQYRSGTKPTPTESEVCRTALEMFLAQSADKTTEHK